MIAKNVFVVDAGSFVSQADKNPTWTIMALSWRTSDFIVETTQKTESITMMNRRQSIKRLVLGTLSAGFIFS
jgi:choline dehydrogenase-like flavoprotein